MNTHNGHSEAYEPTQVKSSGDIFENVPMPAGVALQRARKRVGDYRKGNFFKTGIEPLDRTIRLIPGNLLLIGGRAGSGKTAMGMQIIRNVLKQQQRDGDRKPVLIFSAEMTADGLMEREASAAVNVPVAGLVSQSATAEEYDRMDGFLSGDSGQAEYLDNLFIDESPAPSLQHMLNHLESFSNLALCVFDYVELAGEYSTNQAERVSKITGGLKAIAKGRGIPVIALAQLNRDIEKRADKTIYQSDFMYGGERDADIALGLLRPSQYDLAQPRELVECHIVKYRNGPTGVVNMKFDERTMTFTGGNVIRTPLNG